MINEKNKKILMQNETKNKKTLLNFPKEIFFFFNYFKSNFANYATKLNVEYIINFFLIFFFYQLQIHIR